MNSLIRYRISRFLIFLVLLVNTQSGITFLAHPSKFTAAYELSGNPGEAAIQGFGVLFIMWNVPYAIALINPNKYYVSLWEAIIMQSIGIFGESWILGSIPEIHTVLRASLMRFIIFDAAGLIALILAAWMIKINKRIEVN